MARSFGVDAPEFMEFTVGGSKKAWKLPLAASMPPSVSVRFAEVAAIADAAEQELAAQRLQIDILDRYCPGLTETATTAAVAEIFTAWMEESEGQGATPGE